MFHLRPEGHFPNRGPAAPAGGEGQPGAGPSPTRAALLRDLRATRPPTLFGNGQRGPGLGARAPKGWGI